MVFHPRDLEVQLFLSRVASGHAPKKAAAAAPEVSDPIRPYPALNVRKDLACNLASRPSPQCTAKLCAPTRTSSVTAPTTGRPCQRTRSVPRPASRRVVTPPTASRTSLRAARSALAHAQVGPDQIGAVFVCTCTSDRLIPSVATWLSGQLGIQQTHCSFDLVAACAGLSYGLAEATRILQLVRRPVLVVCAEKFSNKIGNVRPSRMIFGDGAAAIVVGLRA